MKKLILIALAFVSIQAVAQDQRRLKAKEGRKAKMDMRHDLTAEEMATISTKKMTLALDLTEKQQVQVKEVMLAQAETMKAKRSEREEMKKEKGEKKVSKEEHVKMLNKRLDDQIAMKKKMKSILTSEQYEKWENMQGRRQHKNKGKHKDKSKH
ncbi:Spy/CpxP family protein refolding chaperone [Psychroserpens luteolus]|uniref:Spy/CpxP family protein refolding chaperone n=1 Tax=Psychroserpens luteolus TaxID=2855840 RepID=UPI001E32F11C|nr:Spy/CpxP family protein refolding chaperone [Psychroserpens luteolus]MCD2260662.1 hypothetical protein [Psychroserpens luteolus]